MSFWRSCGEAGERTVGKDFGSFETFGVGADAGLATALGLAGLGDLPTGFAFGVARATAAFFGGVTFLADLAFLAAADFLPEGLTLTFDNLGLVFKQLTVNPLTRAEKHPPP